MTQRLDGLLAALSTDASEPVGLEGLEGEVWDRIAAAATRSGARRQVMAVQTAAGVGALVLGFSLGVVGAPRPQVAAAAVSASTGVTMLDRTAVGAGGFRAIE